ncbi:MAG TPA: hypothetical protein VNW30_05745 [Opitutaceae bacterium]|jgi:hypothetical protein|nr:hypothetical protein [Opitutaceae bacterium]
MDHSHHDNSVERRQTFDEKYEKIVELAHKEVERVHGAYKWLLSAVALVVIVGLYFSYNSIKDFRDEIRDQGKQHEQEMLQQSADVSARIRNELTQTLNNSLVDMRSQLRSQGDELAKSVAKRVEDDFRTANITELIHQTAAKRVSEVADQEITAAIDTRLKPKISEAESRLETINEALASAKITQGDLNFQSQFMMTILRGLINDHNAYDTLGRWSQDPSFKYHDEAAAAAQMIMDNHNSLFPQDYQKPNWKPGIDPTKIPFDQFKRVLVLIDGVYDRMSLLQYIWQDRKDIPVADKMDFLVELMKTDPNLQLVEQAGRYFTSESKQKIKPLATDVLIDWWTKNGATYRNEHNTNAISHVPKR